MSEWLSTWDGAWCGISPSDVNHAEIQNSTLIVDFYKLVGRVMFRLPVSFNSAGGSAELGVTSLGNEWFLTVTTKSSSTNFVTPPDKAWCPIWLCEVKKSSSPVSEVQQVKYS